MSFLDHIEACNRRDMTRYRPFRIGAAQLGWVRDDMAAAVGAFPDVFQTDAQSVTLNGALRDFAARTAAVDGVLRQLRRQGWFKAWRDELYAVATGFGAPALLAMERAAVPLFGVRAYGVHLNGYVRQGDGIRMWIGRRSPHKAAYPNKLDNMVAGGLSHGLTPWECLLKECEEEAGIGVGLARKARPVGAISYCAETEEGLRPDLQFCYDLELPGDFTPVCRDGEIAEFKLLPIAEVAALVRDTDEFKFNCNLVIIDFLVRHGLLGPEERDYVAIVHGLHPVNPGFCPEQPLPSWQTNRPTRCP
jgi:8-oxo-dGTP pyrophosphatase MutT (NUDIX family)